MECLDIAEVTAQTGVKPSALRYYEEKGLIQSIGRHGLRRQYGPLVLEQLALIALGKLAGFTLDEIAAMFAPNGRPDLPRQDIRARAASLERQARQLEALSQMMRHVADCPAPSHLECETFQKLLRLAPRAQRVQSAQRQSAHTKDD